MKQKAKMYTFETLKGLNKSFGWLWKIHQHRLEMDTYYYN